MLAILDILVTSATDPILWFQSMSPLGYRKGKKKCVCSAVIAYLIIVIKGFEKLYINRPIDSVVLSVSWCMFVFGSTVLLHGGLVYERVINMCKFMAVLFGSEIVVFTVYFIFGQDSMDRALDEPITNFYMGLIATILKIISCLVLFGRKKYRCIYEENQIKLSFLIILSYSVVIILMFYNRIIYNGKSADLLFMEIIEAFGILLVWYMINSFCTVKNKNHHIRLLNCEVEHNVEREEAIQNLSFLKHDLTTHITIMKNLLEYKEYEKLENYMNATFRECEKAELLYDHPNLIVRIIITDLMRIAKEMRIPFSARIQVEKFGINDSELSSLLRNLIMNGLEASTKVSQKDAYVLLQIFSTEYGYEIRCLNTSVHEVDFHNTSKEDKQNHGLGSKIIDNIVFKYHGKIERTFKAGQHGIGIVVVSIQFQSTINN